MNKGTLKLYLLTGVFFVLLFVSGEYFIYKKVEMQATKIRFELADVIRGILMSTREVYQKQYIYSEVPLTEKTVGFLPAHAMNRISKTFSKWSDSGITFNNVSDRPRSIKQQADEHELKGMEFFRKRNNESVYVSSGSS